MFFKSLQTLLPVPKTRRSKYVYKRLRLHNYIDHFKGQYKKLKQNATRGAAYQGQLNPEGYVPKFRFDGFWGFDRTPIKNNPVNRF